MAGMTVSGCGPRLVAPGDMTELVRGQETGFLATLEPVVRRESVALDLGRVERIDAAGLAALIQLYCEACKAGNSFTVERPGRHVREVLELVGLERILCEPAGMVGEFQETAA